MREFIDSYTNKKGIQKPANAVPGALNCKTEEIEPWRVFRIMSEFVEGFDTLKNYGLAATFFGSARENLDKSIYADAERLAGKLAKAGFTVITGGGHGIMGAANKGAYEAGGNSVGFTIELPNKKAEPENDYLTEHMHFDHFFSRKVMLALASEVYIYFPGGFGTMDEFFEILTLVQTQKILQVPIVLYDKEYWTPLTEFIDKNLVEKHKTVSKEETELYHIVDSVEEAFEYISEKVKGDNGNV